jgi:hypothetical protein
LRELLLSKEVQRGQKLDSAHFLERQGASMLAGLF